MPQSGSRMSSRRQRTEGSKFRPLGHLRVHRSSHLATDKVLRNDSLEQRIPLQAWVVLVDVAFDERIRVRCIHAERDRIDISDHQLANARAQALKALALFLRDLVELRPRSLVDQMTSFGMHLRTQSEQRKSDGNRSSSRA